LPYNENDIPMPDKTPSQQRVQCEACNNEFADDDELLEHIYAIDSCYRAHLALDKRQMGKE
jgi:hypothetical protein